MRCPHCGARNPETAEWCSQCFEPVRPAAPAQPARVAPPRPRPPMEPTPVEPVWPVEPARPRPPGQPASAEPQRTPVAGRVLQPDDDQRTVAPPPDQEAMVAGGGRFRRIGDQLEWRCGVCEHWNPVGSNHCSVCGTPFGRTLGVEPDIPLVRHVDQATLVVASAVLPGVGHVLLGRTVMGVVRAATFLAWLIGGWLLARSAAAAGQSILPAVPLLLGALAVWASSIYDALAASTGGRELLTPRAFFWLVVVVVGLLVIGFVPSLLRVGSVRQGGQ